MSFLEAASLSKFPNSIAFLQSLPTTILDGKRLSFKACPSLRNSGENIIFVEENFSCNFLVYPIGIVDLIIIVAFLLIEIASRTTVSRIEVSNLFIFES